MGAIQQIFAAYGPSGIAPGNRYFIEGTDQLWSNPDNWWLDDAGTQPAGEIPTASDDVFIQTGTCSEDSACASLTVALGATLTNNQGTVTNNYGTVTNNEGEVTINNYGTVTTNTGIVTTNDGTVTTNGINGTITTNNNTVTTNDGAVTTNASTGTVEDHYGFVVTNEGTIINCYGAVIDENGGTIINDYR